jgi:lipopolysaccharide/colanic/teichoic acid biosynthesis glycosyltransferase
MWPGKRLFDVFWSALGLAILWPALLMIAIAVRMQDGGPVFVRQQRVGYRGRLFRIWKFRTMVPQAALGGALTVGDDPRITRVGATIRRLKLDELPQLFNVIGGTMSLVGPRPELPVYVAQYTEAQRKVLELKPGITGVASRHYRHESAILGQVADPERFYVETIVPDKIRMCLTYGARASLWSDLRVILGTLGDLFRARDLAPWAAERIGGVP